MSCSDQASEASDAWSDVSCTFALTVGIGQAAATSAVNERTCHKSGASVGTRNAQDVGKHSTRGQENSRNNHSRDSFSNAIKAARSISQLAGPSTGSWLNISTHTGARSLPHLCWCWCKPSKTARAAPLACAGFNRVMGAVRHAHASSAHCTICSVAEAPGENSTHRLKPSLHSMCRRISAQISSGVCAIRWDELWMQQILHVAPVAPVAVVQDQDQAAVKQSGQLVQIGH